MSGSGKGTRKSKKDTDKGKNKISPELLIASLMAGIYALFVLEAAFEEGQNALLLSVFLTVTFLIYAYLVRAGTVKGPKDLGPLISVFLGLSILFVVLEVLIFFKVIGASGVGNVLSPAVIGVVLAIASAILIAALLYFEKDSLKHLYVRLGDMKNIQLGIFGFILCILVAIIAAYFLFGGTTVSLNNYIELIASVLVFAVLAGAYEELWFRGLLLTRIKPLLGDSHGNIYQAAVFGIFETMVFFALTAQVAYLPVFFILGAMTGYYWGRTTQRFESLVTPALLHAGFYVLILLPLLVGT